MSGKGKSADNAAGKGELADRASGKGKSVDTATDKGELADTATGKGELTDNVSGKGKSAGKITGGGAPGGERQIRRNNEARNAVLIGGICSVSYLGVYVARNVLSAVTPGMLEDGVFTTERVGFLSSLYFITYAVGQLINGALGDRVKSRIMISGGMAGAGLLGFVFQAITGHYAAACVVYAATGLFLSMIYGPITKTVSENTSLRYATRCSLGYTLASLLGSPVAGILASFLAWRHVFLASSAMLLLMAAVAAVTMYIMERRGIILQRPYVKEKRGGGVKILLRRQIVQFSLIAMITGIVRTTVVFWLPTYFTQRLGYSPRQSSLIFTASTFIISLSAFVAIFVYEQFFRSRIRGSMLLFFAVAAACFAGSFFVKGGPAGVALIVGAVFFSNCGANMLYSCYCPSLSDTGHVSGATGFVDFCSYTAASAASSFFSGVVDDIGWSGLIWIWFALMVAGFAVSAFVRDIRVKD